MAATTQRGKIVQALAADVLAKYGPAGTVGTWFRAVSVGPMRPLAAMRPVCYVYDAGQQRALRDDPAHDGCERLLTVEVAAMLHTEWSKVDQAEDWTDRMETLIASTDRSLWSGCGVLACYYTSDDPMDVAFQSAGSNAVWIAEFEVHYVQG